MDPKRAQSRICLETIVNLTQSCSNKNYVYSTTMGIGSGFASEFNFYLIKSMLFGVFSNRRLIYLISKRTWEYDCPEQLGWACYLSFGTCPDRIVEPKDMDFSTLYSPHLRLKQSGPAYFDRPQISEMQYTPDYYMNVINAMKTSVYEEEFTALFKQQQQQSGSNNTAICDIQTEDIHKNDLAGILSNVLFQFNNKTKQGIATINNRYSHLHNRPYAGFLLRLTDKIDEVPEVDWPYLFNMNTVANRFLEVLHNYTGTHPKTGNAIKDIFLGTSYKQNKLNVLQSLSFLTKIPCFRMI